MLQKPERRERTAGLAVSQLASESKSVIFFFSWETDFLLLTIS